MCADLFRWWLWCSTCRSRRWCASYIMMREWCVHIGHPLSSDIGTPTRQTKVSTTAHHREQYLDGKSFLRATVACGFVLWLFFDAICIFERSLQLAKRDEEGPLSPPPSSSSDDSKIDDDMIGCQSRCWVWRRNMCVGSLNVPSWRRSCERRGLLCLWRAKFVYFSSVGTMEEESEKVR